MTHAITSRRGILAGLGLAAVAPAARAAPPSPAGGLQIQRLAWAGIRLRVGEASVFLDATAPDPGAGRPGPVLASDTSRSFALVTHHHGDHCDPAALKVVLGARGYIVAHEDAARMVDSKGVVVQPVRLYEPVFLSRGGGEFAAWCVPALDGFGGPQVSWIVDGGGRRIIHCGDTAWHGHWWDIARAHGPFDAAFLPINGLRQIQGRFTDSGQPMGLTAEQAAAAAAILGARLVIPIHYGATGDPAYIEHADAERVFLRAAAARNLKTRVLGAGEVISL